jgi:hypothetical protein
LPKARLLEHNITHRRRMVRHLQTKRDPELVRFLEPALAREESFHRNTLITGLDRQLCGQVRTGKTKYSNLNILIGRNQSMTEKGENRKHRQCQVIVNIYCNISRAQSCNSRLCYIQGTNSEKRNNENNSSPRKRQRINV